MKLLLDEHLSPQLVPLLADLFPDSRTVLSVGLGGATDAEVRHHAESEGLVIVSKDADFIDAVTLAGAPKLIRIALGNCRTSDVHAVLRNSHPVIVAFGSSDDLILELP